MIHERTHRLARLAAVLAALIVAVAVGAARAADPAPAPEVSAQDQAARVLLLGMADFMARAPAMSVTMRSGYDAIQADGQRIEFGERRSILMQRPDKIRVEVERSDGERGTVVFDGRWITAFKPAENVYARVEKPGSIDETLVYMVRDLRATVPLARMFTTGFPVDLDKRATSVTFVEECSLFDVPTDHLAVRTGESTCSCGSPRAPSRCRAGSSSLTRIHRANRNSAPTCTIGACPRSLKPPHSRSFLRPAPSRSCTSHRDRRRMARTASTGEQR